MKAADFSYHEALDIQDAIKIKLTTMKQLF